MAAIIPNQPVSFGKDITNPDECKCQGANYVQLANTSDPISFQIGNPCSYAYNDILLSNVIFGTCDLTDWSESDVNGFTNTWDASGCTGAVAGVPNTKILWQNNGGLTIDQMYEIFLNISFGDTGCVAYIVVSTDGFTLAANYDVIYTITESGNYIFDYIAKKEYSSIGIFVAGNCEIGTTVSLFSMYDMAINECVEFCVKDSADNVIVDSTDFAANSNIQYFYNYISVLTSWFDLGIDTECPNIKICVCNAELTDESFYYGDNLITIGDNGTFENTADGWVDYSGNTILRDYQWVWRGIYSGKAGNNPAAANGLLIANNVYNRLMLKPNTKYLLSGKVLFRQDPDSWGANPDGTIEATIGGATVSAITSVVMTVPAASNVWQTVSLLFETDSSFHQVIGFGFNHFGFPTTLEFSVYFDDIVLMEYDNIVSCSQLFHVSNDNPCTLNLRWTNENDAFGFGYDSVILVDYLRSHFFQSLRISGKLRSPKYPSERIIYKDSKGERQMVYADREKTIELVIEDQPEYIHDAIAVGLEHDTFTIDGIAYVPIEESYIPNNRKSSLLAPAVIELTPKVQNLINKK